MKNLAMCSRVTANTKWSETTFRARIDSHAKRLGFTMPELCRAANIAADYFEHEPAHGRNVRQIMRLADVLQVPIHELLTFENGNEYRLDPHKISMIMRSAALLWAASMNPVHNGSVDARSILQEIIKLAKQTEPLASERTGFPRRSPPSSPGKAKKT
jgi:hypothetical protein